MEAFVGTADGDFRRAEGAGVSVGTGIILLADPSWFYSKSAGHFFKHFDTNMTRCDFAQCDDGGFVIAVDLGCVTLQDLTRTVSGGECQLEAIRYSFKAVFDSNASHAIS